MTLNPYLDSCCIHVCTMLVILTQECCEKVFWWKENCEATPVPTTMPSSAPTQLRGSAADKPSCSPYGENSMTSSDTDSNTNGDDDDDGSFSSPIGNGSLGDMFDDAVQNSSSGSSGGGSPGNGSTNDNKKNMHILADADSYIRLNRPDKNYGSKKHLIVGTDADTVTLIKFDMKRFRKNSNCFKKATLNLYSLTMSRNGGMISTYDPKLFSRDEHWEENSITWSNAPKERPYKFNKDIGRVRKNEWVDIDVTKELGSTRFVTFRIAGGKWNKYASKESRHPPILSVDLC